MSTNGQAVRTTFAGVRDPWGWFFSHNTNLVKAMIRRPKVAQITRAVLEGIDVYAHERGLPPDSIDFDASLRREGVIVIRLRGE
jgi:hypothetical protein